MSDAANKAVFLSYASHDAEAAKRICEALRAAGVEVWFDQSELVGGDAWDAKIRGQIASCALFVPVISANTQARLEGYFRLEWKIAAQRTHTMADEKVFLLPVVIDETRDADAKVPAEFRAVQWTKAPGGEVPVAFGARVKKLLGGVAEMEAGRPRPAERGEGTAPSSGNSLPRWVRPVLASVVVTALVLGATLKMRFDGRAREETVAPAAPNSEARQLVAKAWQTIDSVPEPARAELDAATEYYQRAVALDPTDADVWALGSQIDTWYVAENLDNSPERRESARTKATKALNLSGDSYEARLAQAVYLVRGEGFDTPSSFAAEAEQQLRALLREQPDEPRALLALGHLLRNSKRVDDASELFDRLAQNPAWTATATNAKAWMMYRVGRFDDAVEVVARSVAARPFHGNVRLQGYLAMEWQGDLELAKTALERMPAADLREDYGVYFAVDVYWYRREPEQMLRVLNTAPREWVKSLSFVGPKDYWVGVAQQMAGNEDVARLAWQSGLRLVEQQLAANPSSAQLQLLKGRLLVRLGERAAAEKVFALAGQLGLPCWTAFELGDAEAVMAHPERGAGVSWATLRFRPTMDFLRGDPRFEAYVAAAAKDPKRSPHAKPAALAEPAAAAKPNEKSVAVLAFANLSDDKGNEYFSDGISEELLTVLQKIPGLHVAARTSAFSFKGKNATAQEIGEKLGVANLVEGSVQKSGNRVKISARLSRAATGEQLWSENYTRDLADVFAVQSEIAQTIVAQLRGQLTGDAAAAKAEIQAQVQAAEKGGTSNIEAHELYLQGKYFVNQHTVESAIRAAGLLRRAVELDPQFALAWAALSDAGWVRGGFGETKQDFEEGFKLAREAADRAMALAPDLAAAYLARAHLQIGYDFDWKGAAESLQRAEALAPSDPAVLTQAAELAYGLGQTERAVELGRQAAALDPVNPLLRMGLGYALSSLRRYDEAKAEFQRTIELSPSAPWGHAGVSMVLTAQGKADEAVAEAAKEAMGWSQLYALAIAEWARGNKIASDAALAELIKSASDVAAVQIAWAYAFRQENDRAFDWLERAYRQHDGGLAWTKANFALESLHTDPRWPAFWKKIGMTDEQVK